MFSGPNDRPRWVPTPEPCPSFSPSNESTESVFEPRKPLHPDQMIRIPWLTENPEPVAFHRYPKNEFAAMPCREYLNNTVGPILYHALDEVGDVRPDDPVEFVAAYLLKNKHRCKEMFEDFKGNKEPGEEEEAEAATED